jgi:hypothetical protein
MTSYFLHLSQILGPLFLNLITSVLGVMYVGYSEFNIITHLISYEYNKVYILFLELLITSHSFLLMDWMPEGSKFKSR